jgi:uncharacterized protein (UPF0212 family)
MKPVRKPAAVEPGNAHQSVIVIDAATLRKAEKLIKACEHCNQEGSDVPFVVILDRLTDSDPSIADYEVGPAKCPKCHHAVLQATLVAMGVPRNPVR